MNFQELREEQLKLAAEVSLHDRIKKPKLIGGVDFAFIENKTIMACIVVFDLKTKKVIESVIDTKETTIPYKSGFLAYRLLPAAIDAYHKLKTKPDLLLVNGHGIAHPRRFGFASHLGLVLDTPTIGIASTLLLGSIEKGKIMIEGEHRGFEITTREHARPIYASPGHLVTMGTTLSTIKNTLIPPHKMPEPLHAAHKMAKKEAKKMSSEHS